MSLTAADRVAFGMGGAVYAVKEAAYFMFVLLFYTQVLGLSGTATGFVLFLAIVWDAMSDPMMGTWSDRLHSRWGRRHPFMMLSVLPLAAGFIALFNPPDMALSNMNYLAGWLLFWSLWIRTALTMFSIPHLSLTAEITQDYHQRSTLLGMRTGLLFLMALLLPALSLYSLFGEVDGVDGRFIAGNYVTYGWMSAVIVILASLWAILGTLKHIGKTSITADRMPARPGLIGMWQDFLSTFQNHNFRNVLF